MTDSYCRAVAVSATSIFLSSSQGAGGGRSALYRRPIDGGVFERCTDGLPDWFSTNLNTFCLDASGQWWSPATPTARYTSPPMTVTHGPLRPQTSREFAA